MNGWRFLSLALLVGVFGLALADGLPTFSTAPPLNNFDVYDTGGHRITSATHSGVELRAYVYGAADTSLAAAQYDLTEASDGSWYPGTVVDTTTTVSIYRIDSASDSLLQARALFVGKYGPKGWITPDAIEADAVTADKIASVDGASIQAGTIGSAAYGTASVPATALQSNAAITNLVAGGESLDLSSEDGSSASYHQADIDTLTVWLKLTIDNLLTTEQPGVGTDGELRIASADLYALGNAQITSSPSESLLVSGRLFVGDSLSIGVAGDTTTTHPVTGAFRYSMIQDYSLGTSAINAVYDFDGATSDMRFWISNEDATRRCSVEYSSPGKIRIRAESSLGATDAHVIGFKK